MAQNYYEDLGLKPGVTRAEIKSAYRKLVLQHHPDRSTDPRSKAIFLRVTEANEVLSDPEAKRRYDEHLELLARRAREAAEKRAADEKKAEEAARLRAERQATPSGVTVKEEVLRLQTLFGSGRHSEAEKLAYAIMQLDPRQAVPYAVLADILRGRGYMNEAGKMYAYAVQMDPGNPIYQRRYEMLLRNSRVVTKHGNMRLEAEDKSTLAPIVGGGFAVLAGAYVAFSHEQAVLTKFSLISSWTIGLVIMLFLTGVTTGAALAVGNHLDRFGSITSSSSGRSSPTAILGIVALVNFWVSAILYVMIAIGLRAFNFSTTRLMIGVAAATSFLALASIPSNAIHASQTFLWGGNLVYVGGLVGWMAVDAMREGA
jgi:curved DNA-binding protein CbpA